MEISRNNEAVEPTNADDVVEPSNGDHVVGTSHVDDLRPSNVQTSWWRKPRVLSAAIAAVGAVVVALVGVTWTMNRSSIGGSVTLQQGCVLIQSAAEGCYGSTSDIAPEQAIPALEQAAEDGGAPRADEKPWPFMVFNTGEAKGLYVRDGVWPENRRLQASVGGDAVVLEGGIVFADCYTQGWALDQTSTWNWTKGEGGGRWLKVRWPEPADQVEAYMYAAWLVPINHNGEIPNCGP